MPRKCWHKIKTANLQKYYSQLNVSYYRKERSQLEAKNLENLTVKYRC